MAHNELKVTDADRAHLRELAKRVREIAESPLNQERLRLWHKHDENEGERPLILTETDGGLGMVIPDYVTRCQEPWAKGQEWRLMGAVVHHGIIGDDSPVEPYVNVGWRISVSDYGVEQKVTRPKTDGTLGAYHIDPPIKDLESEIGLLKPRTFSVDREGTLAVKQLLEEVYDGILGVRLRDNPWWTMGMTQTAINLIGLDSLMLYMYDQPEALHRLMAFLRDDHMAFLDWMEKENLLTLNNENDYIGSGSRGYSKRLPQTEGASRGAVKTRDLWALIESQETVGVGPKQFAEFIFPYQNDIAERFGRIYYGCCEPVNSRWHVLEAMANLKRVSVSPWCDEAFMAEALGAKYVYSRKPNPSLISTERFDEDAIRADLLHTFGLTRKNGCTVEVAMKDVHTLHNEPDRLTRWVRIAREAIAEVYG